MTRLTILVTSEDALLRPQLELCQSLKVSRATREARRQLRGGR